jgi:hypothetical protein
MKIGLIASLVLCLLGAGPASWAQQGATDSFPASPASEGVITTTPPSGQATWDRFLFPRNFLRGFTEGGYFPAHNEADMGRCASWVGMFGGPNATCAAFSRYFMGGYAELQPFSRKLGPLPLQRVYLYLEPRAFFGRNVPQFSYTQSFAPILFERTLGIVVAVRKNLEVRIWQHQNDWLGRYRNHLGPADLGTNGPYGMYAGVSTRWYFGGWGRQH